jgi:endonuclease-3 related protein
MTSRPVSSFHRVYLRLLAAHGSQGWWPTTPSGEIRPRYYPNALPRALAETERWEIAVGAVLTQNTAWRNAEQALVSILAEGVLAPQPMAELPLRRLAELVRSSGYYNQKARRLHGLARHLIDRHGGRMTSLLAQPTTQARVELLSLDGIGPETADSILLYAGGHAIFVVDAYTRRILGRLGILDHRLTYSGIQEALMTGLPLDAVLYNEYHALLVRHGSTSCRATPRCRDCSLRRGCEHRKDQSPHHGGEP